MAIQLSTIARLTPIVTQPTSGGTTNPSASKGFGEYLTEALAQIEQSQTNAQVAAQRLATGEISDVSEVMIASERATLDLQLLVQVRNKVIEAYQEVMRMPV